MLHRNGMGERLNAAVVRESRPLIEDGQFREVGYLRAA